MTIGAAVLHGTLGLRRPLDRTYLSFACMMVLLAAYLYFEWLFHRATTSGELVEIVRRQVITVHGFLAGVLVFVPAYTRVRVPRSLLAAYAVALTTLFLTNLLSQYGIWFAALPEVVHVQYRGESYSTVVAPPISPLQYVNAAYVLAVLALALRCAVELLRRGERQRGVVLSISLGLVVLHYMVDLLRDAIDGSWPYVAEFGVVAWGLIMSVQLAIDFRVSERRLRATLKRKAKSATELAALVAATLRVRDRLNTPLQTLELAFALREAATAQDKQRLALLRDAVAEIARLGRTVEQATMQSPSIADPEPAR